jgi:hypothetical protein
MLQFVVRTTCLEGLGLVHQANFLFWWENGWFASSDCKYSPHSNRIFGGAIISVQKYDCDNFMQKVNHSE